MKRTMLIVPICLTFITGCSNTPPCEDILEVKKQAQLCERLKKEMQDPKNPTKALLFRERFKAECEDLRYYRDDYDTICKGEQKPIGEKTLKTRPTEKKQ
jgi:hypothetical protein